jgi:YHS domain-containing protein
VTGVHVLTSRIDQELEVEVQRQKAAWTEVARVNRERAPRLERFDAVATRVIAQLKPRLEAFIERFQPVVKAEPSVREHTRAMHLTFSATIAKVTLQFEVFPDREVKNLRLECTQDFIPAFVPYDKQAFVEFPFEAVPDDAVVQWFDDRIVAFVKAYIALIRQDSEFQEHLKDVLVEDPVAKIRFPRFLAASTLERDGQTYYFVDEETRREFEKTPAAKP